MSKKLFAEITMPLCGSDVKTSAKKQLWPFQVSYVHDISTICPLDPCSNCDVHTVFSRTGIALYFTFTVWDEEDILKTSTFWVSVSHAHTLFAPISTPYDSLASIVCTLNKLKPHALKKVSGQFIYLFTDISFLFLLCNILLSILWVFSG